MPGITLLRIKGGKRHGSPLKLDGTQFTFGRSSECDLRLSSDAASRKHAVIRLKGDAWYVEDLGSRNGTFLNGKKVSSGALRASDVVKFGESGAKIQIIGMDPAPARDAAGDEETRYLRVAGDESAPRLAEPMRDTSSRSRSAPPPAPAPKEKKGAPAWLWILPLLGIAFGIVTAAGVWDEITKDFPYAYVTAPFWLLLRGLAELKVELTPDTLQIVFYATLAVWFGLLGFFLRRPWKYRFLIIFWLIIHGVAIGTLPDAVK
jgi:hypothetical protein